VAGALGWLARASLPVAQFSDPLVIRAALDALTARLDGGRAAAATIARKRAVFHDALGYAVELGLLQAYPVGQARWTAPIAARGGAARRFPPFPGPGPQVAHTRAQHMARPSPTGNGHYRLHPGPNAQNGMIRTPASAAQAGCDPHKSAIRRWDWIASSYIK
jgi:hypothetical protein